MDKNALRKEIDTLEVFDFNNLYWIENEIRKSLEAGEITEADKRELMDYYFSLERGPPDF